VKENRENHMVITLSLLIDGREIEQKSLFEGEGKRGHTKNKGKSKRSTEDIRQLLPSNLI